MLLNGTVANDGIVDRYTRQIVVDGIISIDKGVRDVRHVIAAIGLSGEVYFAVLHTKCFNKLLVESDKLLTKLDFIGDVWCSLRETDADWLLNPQHVGQVDPCVGVLDRLVSSCFPSERTVFREETTQRAASGTAVEPAETCQ